MGIIYILLILLGAFPLCLTAWRMRRAAKVKKHGIHVNGNITHIRRVRLPKGGSVDILTITYKDRATGIAYNGKATVSPGKYRSGDTMSIAYLPGNPSQYAIDSKGGNTLMLIFCIVLFLFILFAVYKINQAVVSGQM